MTLSISKLIVSGLQLWFSATSFTGAQLPEFPTSPELQANFSCDKPVWEKQPVAVRPNVYGASMSATCRVQPQMGGDLRKLQAFSLEQIKTRATIHRGPDAVTFEGIPALFVDATLEIKGKDAVAIRQDVNLATDIEKKFISSSVSTKINGTGNGAYVKKMDTRIDVAHTDVKGEDLARVVFYTEVEKPWYAPEGMFLSEIQKRVPGEFSKLVDKMLDETSKNY